MPNGSMRFGTQLISEVVHSFVKLSSVDPAVCRGCPSFTLVAASLIFTNLGNASSDPSNHFPPVILERKTLKFAPQPKKKKSLWPVKDIHDFDRVHGDWLEHAAVTLVVHHHHEEVAAGDLLDDEGPANHSRRQR